MANDVQISDQEISEAVAAAGQIGQHRRSLDAAAKLVAFAANGRSVVSTLSKQIDAKRAELDALNAETIGAAVAEGNRQRDEIIAEAKANAAKIIADAQSGGRAILALIPGLQQEKEALETQIRALKDRAATIAK